MKKNFRLMGALALGMFCLVQMGARGVESVRQEAREVAVAAETEVLVVGGTSAAVASAVAAAEAGAKVFLVAPRPYLGEDLCATYRLWLDPGVTPEGPLAQRLFQESPAPVVIQPGLDYSYTTSIPSGGAHPDTEALTRLKDGQYKDAYKDSVEYPGSVTITVDLGTVQDLGRIHVLAFQRRANIELAQIQVALSEDGTQWREGPLINNSFLGKGEYIDLPLHLTAALSGKARYLKLDAAKTEVVERILLGEIIVEPHIAQADPAPKALRRPPTPLQVKRELDTALVDAGVPFLYGCRVTDLIRDDTGGIAGILMVNRAGRQAVRAKVIIDATERATVARLAGATFSPYPAGFNTFQRVVIGGEAHPQQDATVETLPTPVVIEGRRYPAHVYTLQLAMPDASAASFAEAEQAARDKTWDKGQVDASEVLFQIPPDAMEAMAPAPATWPGADTVDLDLFQAQGLPEIFVLGGCAGVSREAAKQMLAPLSMLKLGTRMGAAAAKAAGATRRPVVVCFGDSITAGAYPTKLARRLSGYQVVNAGVGGNTTGQGLARLEKDVIAQKPEAVVLLFGTNDSCMRTEGAYKTPLSAYIKNLTSMVKRCQDAGAKVLVCTIPPIIDAPYYERHPAEFYSADGGLQAILDRYRNAAKEVSTACGAALLDLGAELAKDMSSIRADGVHPTAKGERMIAVLVAQALGELLSIEAPEEAQDKSAMVAAPGAGDQGRIREKLSGLRTFGAAEKVWLQESQDLPILGSYDVVVVGGGTGGAPAGISAARHGAKTLVVEYLHGLGGVGTLGLISKYYHGYRGGFTAEVDRGVSDLGGEKEPSDQKWNIEWKKEWYRRALRSAGADIWFGVLGCGAVVDGKQVKGVLVTTPEGRGIVWAKTVIDSTGNAEIAAIAGAECIHTEAEHIAVQGTGLPPMNPGKGYTNTDYTLTQDADVIDRWRSFVAAKNRFDEAYDIGQLIDTRERQRIIGDFMISPLDIYYERTYPDSIGVAMSNFDTHGFTVHPFFMLQVPEKKSRTAFTPYRALLPKGLEGILVTGLGISAHRDAMPILRMQPDVQNQGYAAGMAAAMSAATGSPLREIDLPALQKHLVEIGNLPKEALNAKDNFPFPQQRLEEAVRSLEKDYEAVGIVLLQAQQALPMLQEALKQAKTEQARLIYAHVLTMMGQEIGASLLLDKLAQSDWDEGWRYTGMGQFGGSLSTLDSYIIALGRAGIQQALPAILEKVAVLDTQSAFSHFRSVALALESLGDSQAAPALAALLNKPGMRGHAYIDIEDAIRGAKTPEPNYQRDRSLRELILARALYRCGDYEGLGKAILEEYQSDLRGHHARHAHAILQAE